MLSRSRYSGDGHAWNSMSDMQLGSLGGFAKRGFGRTPRTPPWLRACCHPRGPVEGRMDCGRVEAGVGSIRTHQSRPTSPHVSDPGEGVTGEDLSRKHWTTLTDCELGWVGTEHPLRSEVWRTVQHVSVASQNTQLTTSSTAAHYI